MKKVCIKVVSFTPIELLAAILFYFSVTFVVRADDTADWNTAMDQTKNHPDTLPVSTSLIQIIDANGNRGTNPNLNLQWWTSPKPPTLTGDYVKVVTWTGFIGSYKQDGEVHSNDWPNPTLFVSAGGEVLQYFQNNYPVPGTTAENNVRVQKLEGMGKNEAASKYFVEFWVKPTDLYRPTRDTTITTHTASQDWPDPFPTHEVAPGVAQPDFATFNDYKTSVNPDNGGFDYRMSVAYGYPFTGLGYTYDWSQDGSGGLKIFGVSEFTLNGFSNWIVSGVYATDTYVSSYIVDQPTGTATQSSAYDIAGYGFIKAGNGEFILDRNNAYTGPTTINTGTLTVSVDAPAAGLGSLGDAASAVLLGNTTGTLDAALNINTEGVTIGRPITVQAGSTGTATIGGTNSNGVVTYSGNVVLNKDVYLTAASGGTVNFSGVISGLGRNVTKVGAGMVMFSGNNIHTGATTINEGELRLAADSAGSAFTVGVGGILSGTGTIGGLANNGYVSPGTSTTVGTVTVGTGNYTGTGGQLNLKFTGDATYDTLVVTAGTATLTGTTLKPNVGYAPAAGTIYNNVVTSTGLGGTTFAAIEHATPTLKFVPTYNAASVDLTVQRDLANPALNLNSSQRSLANALGSAPGANSGDLKTVLDAIGQLTTADEVKDAYNQILPQQLQSMSVMAFTGSTIQAQNLDNRLLNLRTGMNSGFAINNEAGTFNGSLYDGVLVASNGDNWGQFIPRELAGSMAAEDKLGFFLNGSGSFGDEDTDLSVNRQGFNYTAAGFTTGIDYKFTKNLILGFNTGYGRTGADIAGSSGTIDVDTVPLGFYGTFFQDQGFYVNGSLGYALNLYDNQRNIKIAGLPDRTANGDTTGHQFNGFIESGYDFKVSKLTVGPTASFQYTKLWIDGYNETGADALDLAVADQTAKSIQSGLGGRVSYEFDVGKVILVPQAWASWQHEFSNNSRGIEAHLAQGSALFQSQTVGPDRNFALLGCGLSTKLSDTVICYLNYDTEVGRTDYTVHSINGGVRVSF